MKVEITERCFNKKHLPLIEDHKHKFLISKGGAGSGKSYSIAQKLIIDGINNRGMRILVVRKTMRSIKDSCFKLLLSILREWKLYPLCKINKSDLNILLPSGTEILCKGLDDPEKVKSITDISVCWVEEATEISADDFEQLILRVRCPSFFNQLILSFNPVSKANWVYKRWFAPDSKIDDDTYILDTTYKDNQFLNPSYISSLENLINTNPTYFRIYAKGEFCSLDKLVYNNWSVQDFDRNTLNGIHCVGCDFGFVNDPTAIVDSVADKDNKILYICRENYSTGKTNDQLAVIIQEMGLAKSNIVCDSAEPKSIAELKKAGILHVRASLKGPDSIIFGVQKLQQYKIIVHPSCEHIIEELENYSWDKDKSSGEYINKPIDSFNHGLDAVRYSIQLVQKQPFTMDKKLLF